MDVGVRELKARLSEYLRRAAEGELVTVTERGRPVAVIGPVLGRVDLSAGIAAGWITPATASGLRPVRRHRAQGSVLQALTEDREGVTTYADSSALLKRYVDEPGSERADVLLASDPELVTARITVVEVRRNLARLLAGSELTATRAAFAFDLASIAIVEVDGDTCELAATIAEQTGVRTLDALHLGAARRLGTAITFLTFDVRQAQAARALGFAVAGV